MLACSKKYLIQLAWVHKLNQINRCLLHDLSNHLTGVLTLSELYCEHPASESLTEGLDIIKKNALKSRDLLMLLAQLNHPQAITPTYIDLQSLLQNLQPIIQAILPSNAHFEIKYEPNSPLPILRGISHIVQQIFLQLICNAGEAVKTAQKPSITLAIDSTDNAIQCALYDNGKGFPKDFEQALFQPFFTSFSDEQHLGLGLFSIKEYLRMQGGNIQIEPCDVGTCIRFSFSTLSM
ncbi:MAG: HAMP domain-containing histidine kinase [Puniceicoccales bacterium]|jgi:C4-dicarboxylate-specific signal transduction histidine kinase|nr:HAMP domain-containing histidine kinase [Puniceicoccales bacterium]